MNIRYVRLFIAAYLLPLLLLLAGCSERSDIEDNYGKESATLYLNLDIPRLNPGHRAMSVANESSIDYGNIHVLVFEEVEQDEVFRYQASIATIIPPQITLEVPISRAQERYRLVVIANADMPYIADGTPKDEALSQFVFDCAGKWNTSDESFSPIPAWGEYRQPFAIKNNMSINVLMHRALARVDIGTLFKFNNPDLDTGQEYPDKDNDKESVWGLDNFKIKDVRIYRTLSKAYVASSADKMVLNQVVTPNAPTSAKYNSNSGDEYDDPENADKHPLVYILPDGSDSYIREIYIPESFAIDAQSSVDNVPCIVVGGYYGKNNTTRITYYRADFATYNNGEISAFIPILRNHRYVFDIHSVGGHGFAEPDMALNSISSDMVFTMEEWNELPLNFYTQGHYFCSIDTRDVSLDARPLENETEISRTVSYRTNLELDPVSNPFTYEWQSSGTTYSEYFDIAIDYSAKTIQFKAKQDNANINANPLSDRIILKIENYQLTIDVRQKAINTSYTLDCSSVKVSGIYQTGLALNYTHYISMKIESNTTLKDIDYEVRTIEKNGIYFLASGTFATDGSYNNGVYEYDLELKGHGTIVNESGNDVLLPFEVTIISNSLIPATCSARIVFGYTTKKILTIGSNARYRYGNILEPNTASRALVDASVNFGTDINSTVIMEEQNGNAFIIECITANQGMTDEMINYEYLANMLETFKPDIILSGQAVYYFSPNENSEVIRLLADFVDKGGVFLMFNEYYPNAGSINAMVEAALGTSVGIGDNQYITNQIYSLPSGITYEDDPILNGPFGDLRGEAWASDGFALHGFTGIDTDNLIVYSERTDGAVCAFRHKTKPFIFIGDGGFISNNQRYLGGGYTGSFVYHPFAISASYKPIPRTNYTTSQNVSVYNSQLFANIIAWAVDYAERQ